MEKSLFYKNGHSLAYTDYGDPNGFPILIQHGLIASIEDQVLFSHLIKTGVRLIGIARPGYGESSPRVMQNIAAWAEIVSDLVDELDLSHFDVFGISSGAPYSYAIGYRFPERVRNVYILSGTPALFDENVLSVWPYPVNKNASIPELQKLADELFFSHLSQKDLEKKDIRDSMAYDGFGVAQDLKIRCLDWGFPLAGVRPPVIMRHSKADENVPWITAEMTAKFLPNCRLEMRENDAHFSQEGLDDFIETVIKPAYFAADASR